MLTVGISVFQDGGSLDLVLRRCGRIPERMIAKITLHVGLVLSVLCRPVFQPYGFCGL